VSADVAGGTATTRFGTVRLIGSSAGQANGHAMCLLRPEHFSIEEAPDGGASADGWRVIDRRFSGSEILLELLARDGERLWVEAGSRVRHLGLGDRVRVRLRDVETVAFGRKAVPSGGVATMPGGAQEPVAAPEGGASGAGASGGGIAAAGQLSGKQLGGRDVR
jgi:hypothetical protein